MFNVTVINLTTDLRTARPDLGAHCLGTFDAAQLEAALETFRAIDPVQNLDAEPQVVVESRCGKYLVRTGQGKLFLYDARDSSIPYVELEPAQMVAALARSPTASDRSADPTTPVRTSPHLAVGVTILAAGLLLSGYTVYSTFYVDDVNRLPPIQLVTDERELAGLRLSVVGHYVTGREPGDRGIVVTADGSVHFTKIVAGGERTDADDTYRIGRGSDGSVCLATTGSGVIDVRNIDTMVYYRDTYRRAR